MQQAVAMTSHVSFARNVRFPDHMPPVVGLMLGAVRRQAATVWWLRRNSEGLLPVQRRQAWLKALGC